MNLWSLLVANELAFMFRMGQRLNNLSQPSGTRNAFTVIVTSMSLEEPFRRLLRMKLLLDASTFFASIQLVLYWIDMRTLDGQQTSKDLSNSLQQFV